MCRLATLLTTALLMGGTAFAQPPPAEPLAPPADPTAPAEPAPADMGAAPMGVPTSGTPAELTRRGVQERAGTIAINGLLGLNMSKELVMKPVTLSPDVYFAVNDMLQIGIVHTWPLRDQTPAGLGASICLGGEERGCSKLYDNVGIDVLYALLNSANGGTIDLSAHVAYWIQQLSDPMLSSIGLGVRGKLHISDILALQFDPQIYIGVNKRDEGNKQMLFIPVELQYQLQPMLALALQTGIWGSTEEFGDNYRAPLGILALYNVSPMLDVGARFSFDNLLGAKPDGAPGRADARTLAVLANLRF
jgi:hypothetical protein